MNYYDILFARKMAGGQGEIITEGLSVTENGTYTAPEGKAYTPVVVNVPTPEDSYQLKSLPIGAISTITDGSNLPMPSLKVGIEPQQDLHGYDRPWAGGAGKNKFDIGDVSSSYWNVSDEQITNAITDVRQNFQLVIQCYYNGQYTGITYLQKNITSTGRVSFTFTIGNNDNVDQLLIKHNGMEQDIIISFVNWTQKGDVTISFDVSGYNPTVAGGVVFSNMQIESGTTATSYAPYSNICPISGHTEANIVVSPTTDAEDGQTYTIPFTDSQGNPITVYGGKLDVVSGVLTVDKGYIASYNGETLPSTWISDRDVYVEGTSPTTGAQVVYELATPITYQLNHTAIKSLLGNNNIWADTGDVLEGSYFKEL